MYILFLDRQYQVSEPKTQTEQQQLHPIKIFTVLSSNCLAMLIPNMSYDVYDPVWKTCNIFGRILKTAKSYWKRF